MARVRFWRWRWRVRVSGNRPVALLETTKPGRDPVILALRCDHADLGLRLPQEAELLERAPDMANLLREALEWLEVVDPDFETVRPTSEYGRFLRAARHVLDRIGPPPSTVA